MKDQQELVVRENELPAPPNILSVISEAVSNPDLDVEKMERLLGMYERVTAKEAEKAFFAAVARVKPKLPQIQQNGVIYNKGVEQSRYALLEDIDETITPLLAEEGLSFSFNEEGVGEFGRTFSARLAHKDGHTETKRLTLALDTSGAKNNTQASGSTVAYAMRYLIKMHLNIVERGQDTGGLALDPISEEQARDLRAELDSLGANIPKFLQWMGVESIETIPKRDWQKAMSGLEARRRKA